MHFQEIRERAWQLRGVSGNSFLDWLLLIDSKETWRQYDISRALAVNLCCICGISVSFFRFFGFFWRLSEFSTWFIGKICDEICMHRPFCLITVTRKGLPDTNTLWVLVSPVFRRDSKMCWYVGYGNQRTLKGIQHIQKGLHPTCVGTL